MKVLEFSTRRHDLPVFFPPLLILLYTTYLVYRLLTSFRSCLFISAVFPISSPLIHHIPCLMFKVKLVWRLFRLVGFDSIDAVRMSIKFYYYWADGYFLLLLFLDIRVRFQASTVINHMSRLFLNILLNIRLYTEFS
jgi:hypothetical protein